MLTTFWPLTIDLLIAVVVALVLQWWGMEKSEIWGMFLLTFWWRRHDRLVARIDALEDVGLSEDEVRS